MTDNAPPTTAKHGDTAEHAASLGLDGKGNALLSRSVTINRRAAELYAYWRDFSNLASFMENVESVEVRDDTTSHWTVKGPGGSSVEWDAQITQDIPGQAIAWTSVNGPDVSNSGRIEFRDCGQRGTVVTATIHYDAPAGIVGRAVAKLFQREPGIQARRDLRRFKQLMETGEIATNAPNLKQHEEEAA